MAWDMVYVAIQKIQSKTEIPRLPFAGLCCVLRAGLAVLETRGLVDEDVVEDESLRGFRRTIEWFATRWDLGSVYLRRLDELIALD